MRESEMRLIGKWIARILREGEDAIPVVKTQVEELCRAFPLYEEA